MRKRDEVLLDNLIYGNPVIADKYRNAWKRIKKEKCTRSTSNNNRSDEIALLECALLACSNFSFEAWDVERDEWCRVTNIDVDNNSIGLSNGVVRFWRELNVTKLRTPLIKERVTNIIGGRRREDEI